MRPLALVFFAACWPSSTPPAAPPVPTAEIASRSKRGCSDAAAGLERGTRGIRPPEEPVLGAMRARCLEDDWPNDAIACFSSMDESDLGRCAMLLPAEPRDRMFETLGGGVQDRTSVAIALAKLSALHVGIPECDLFVTAVANAMSCERMAIEARAQLGSEAADFWSLPTTGLPADAERRMAEVCARSRASLEQQVLDAGCMP